MATSLLARPSVYRLPASLPFLGIGETVYDPAFDSAHALWPWQERLGQVLLPELPSFQTTRTANAGVIAESVRAAGWAIPALSSGPLRLPVLAPSRSARDGMVRALSTKGVSASGMYPGTLADIPELRPHLADPAARVEGARALAHRLLTLPVYPALRAKEVAHIRRSFEEVARALASA
jgi:dTDP-4-amino-4,6-dideoxygalactose transaminase